MPLDHLEASTFSPHLGNWSVLILDSCLSPQNFALMELLINQKKMGSSFHEVLKYYNPCYTIKQGLKCEQLVRLQVQSIVEWTSVNHKQLNFKKTWAMLLKGKSTKALPVPVASIEWKPSLKLLGVTFQSDPCNWDLHLDNKLFYRKLVVVCTSHVFVNSMDCRWIIFILFLLILSYLYLHMLWKYGAVRIIISTVNPLLSPPGGLFFSSTFEGGLKREGGLIKLRTVWDEVLGYFYNVLLNTISWGAGYSLLAVEATLQNVAKVTHLKSVPTQMASLVV